MGLVWNTIYSVISYFHVAREKLAPKLPTMHLVIHSKYFSISDWLKFIIHHRELLLTKFGKKFCHFEPMTSKVQPKLQTIEPLTEKTWGRGWVVLIERTKWLTFGETPCSFHGEILSKIIPRTARRQLDGRHLLFRVYLQTWTDLYLLNLPIKMRYRYELNIDRGKHVLGCF